MSLISYIVWDPNPEIFPDFIDDWEISPRYYGLLFTLGFIFGQQILFYIFRKEGRPQKDVEVLTIYMVFATLIGARLGHAIFYEPEVYLRDPIEILRVWRGGLDGHGAAIGILIGVLLYSNYYLEIKKHPKIPLPKAEYIKKKKADQSFLWVSDRLVIVIALVACFIRTGNFINSEVIGKPTSLPIGVVFARSAEESIASNPAIASVEASKGGRKIESGIYKPVLFSIVFTDEDYPENGIRDYLETEVKHILSSYPAVTDHFFEPHGQPLHYRLFKQRGVFHAEIETLGIGRHPAQLYEAAFCMVLFMILLVIWIRKKQKTREGLLLSVFLISLFSLRFFFEFIKENQVPFENEIPLNMGQWLSIPFILAGFYLILKTRAKTTNQGTGS